MPSNLASHINRYKRRLVLAGGDKGLLDTLDATIETEQEREVVYAGQGVRVNRVRLGRTPIVEYCGGRRR